MDTARIYRTNIERELTAIESDGLLYLKHGTNITIICLLPNHPALKSPVENVNFFQKQAKIVGKGKKGAVKVESRSRLCEIKNTDGTTHLIRYGVDGTLLEYNAKLIENPELLRKSPTFHGYLGIVLIKSPKRICLQAKPVTECVP